ncbi:MAG: tRNA uridine-5-carboxymethylaminomethyl(34) synthesis GTPase MnmE [Alphaproteobacteria bacterium]
MSTIFALITSPSRAGVAIVRISGPQALNCLSILGCKKIPQSHQAFLQKLYNPFNNQLLDKALITYFKSPKSYTGEDVVEINLHASPFVIKTLHDILLQQVGIRLSLPGEFSKRAFLNGKIDLVQAQAIPDLIASETEIQHQQAIKQLDGELGNLYEKWRTSLLEAIALIQANIDFPDEDIPTSTISRIEEIVKTLITEIKNHLNDNYIGQKIKDGLNLVILGSVNAGKSSLINFLTRNEIAIVSDIAGTTRDVIETHLSIKGLMVKIADTAGIRKTNDPIEQEGINRALKKSQNADLKILVIDLQNPNFDHDLIDNKTIILLNKIDKINGFDLKNFINKHNLNNFSDKIIAISITKNINTSQLIKLIEDEVEKLIPKLNYPAITQERYRIILNNCLENLNYFSLKNNIEISAHELWQTSVELGKITGKFDIENILDIIFSSFCIGK